MASNRIGCSAGKTHLIDPNNFSGQGSFDNVSVPLEDLTISVQLKTYKKGRTVLSASNGIHSIESSQTVAVTFIEGSVVNGEKVLTSKFTDLTTVLDQGSGDGENLGITNIDIDFNSSYAPLITIDFIDLRGSSIFQNEQEILGGRNKYSVFFQLPYPLYELTIKGYYGQPVKYCLHMTKFNSKFNSQTGNFEITGNFIGYTYAMLSDMLLGILKAIPYTEIGAKKYLERKGLEPTLLNLNELTIQIDKIDENVKKIAASSPDAAKLQTLRDLDALLDGIKGDINKFGSSIDFKSDLTSDYRYIAYDGSYDGALRTQYYESIGSDKVGQEGKIVIYNQKNVPGYTLDLGKFMNIDVIPIKVVDVSMYKLQKGTVDDLEKQNEVYSSLSNRNLGVNTSFKIYNMTSFFKIIEDAKTKLYKEITETEKTLSLTIKDSITNGLGFEPTIRNIVNTFTVAVEVYLSVMFEVSNSAENHPERDRELSGVFREKGNSDLKHVTFFPWPQYNENTESNGYQDKYLGTRGVLPNPDNVDELFFIKDLFNGFITAKKLSNAAALENNDIDETTWVPTNPFDSLLYNETEPYSRLGDATTLPKVALLSMIRCMTFLGYTNFESVISDADIIKFATIEANAIINNPTISNDVKQALSQQNVAYFLGANGQNINKTDPNPKHRTLSSRKVINQIQSSNYYYYDYIFTGNSASLKVIPISGEFQGEWNEPKDPADTVNQTIISKSFNALEDGQTIFLTNYNSYAGTDSYKPKDGGQYIDFISIGDFESKISGREAPLDDAYTLTLDQLKAGTNINIFNGVYGITEFKKLDYQNSNLVDLPLRYVFYKRDITDFDNLNNITDNNGLALKRENGVISGFDLPPSISNTTKLYGGFYNSDLKQKTTDKFPTDINISSNSSLHKQYGNNRYLFKLINSGDENVRYPYLEQKYFTNQNVKGSSTQRNAFSLFGSKLYYHQDKVLEVNKHHEQYNKALLFLSILPWNGYSFESPEILNLFQNAGGFIHVPRLWCAYIGGLIWRGDDSETKYEDDGKTIKRGSGSGTDDPILWNWLGNSGSLTEIFSKPTKKQYWTVLEDYNNGIGDDYEDYHKLLTTLPEKVKENFKQVFFDFVTGNNDKIVGVSWESLRNGLEIWDGTGPEFYDWINGLYNQRGQPTSYSATELKVSYYKNSKLKLDNYSIVTTDEMLSINSESNGLVENGNLAVFLELKDDASVNKLLVKALTEEVVIANAGFGVWNPASAQLQPEELGFNTRQSIKAKEKNVQTYVKTMVNIFKGITPETISEANKIKREIFGSESDEVIQAQLYRTCKNVYDKWIGGATDGDNIIFQCGGKDRKKPLRNSLDSKLSAKNRTADKERLIDSFRFVTRSFRDIGDEFFIDPRPINKYLDDNPNSSFYGCITDLLSSNNFDFIALPSYINYNDPKTMESIFDPVSYKDAIEDGICGPSFVCVYVGQTSKNLDFKDSEYRNDGFDVQCDKDGNMNPLPSDFAQDSKPYENNVAVFKVGYSQQNQNIFKDITLDQSEFTETDESLKIIDDISKTGSENQHNLAGQNIYGVYSVRSYKAEVEMMGNAMIQPMMYFQLDNIPMFHGAYMITHVKHSIKPNSMSTHFTGVRIRHPETPILKANELYMSLLDNIEITATQTTGIGTAPLSLDALKDKISVSKFNTYKAIRYTQYTK